MVRANWSTSILFLVVWAIGSPSDAQHFHIVWSAFAAAVVGQSQ